MKPLRARLRLLVFAVALPLTCASAQSKTVVLKLSWVDAYKDQATIAADFIVDHAHARLVGGPHALARDAVRGGARRGEGDARRRPFDRPAERERGSRSREEEEDVCELSGQQGAHCRSSVIWASQTRQGKGAPQASRSGAARPSRGRRARRGMPLGARAALRQTPPGMSYNGRRW